MYGIAWISNSLDFRLQGTNNLFLIPAPETCAFCTSLQAKGEQEQSGECLLISKILPSDVDGIFHAKKKNPSSQALQFEKAIKRADPRVVSVTWSCCAFNKDHCVALKDLSFHTVLFIHGGIAYHLGSEKFDTCKQLQAGSHQHW